LANIERQSLTAVACSIHHLTCKQDSRDYRNEAGIEHRFEFPWGLSRLLGLYSTEDGEASPNKYSANPV